MVEYFYDRPSSQSASVGSRSVVVDFVRYSSVQINWDKTIFLHFLSFARVSLENV